jgi:methionine-rich copper-binding protein CopC
MRMLAKATLLTMAITAFTLAAAPVDAAMHLRLTKSSPAKDTVLAAAPAQISLWYSQEPTLRLSSVTLTGPNGAVALGAVAQDPRDKTLLTAKVEGAMPPGAYTIAWRTASSDGHPIRGEIPFRVR